jgi:hypothetical protein
MALPRQKFAAAANISAPLNSMGAGWAILDSTVQAVLVPHAGVNKLYFFNDLAWL